MKIIPNWRKAWRMATVQIGALAVLWIGLPEKTQAAILDAIHIDKEYLPGLIGIAVILGRLVSQPKVRESAYKQESMFDDAR